MLKQTLSQKMLQKLSPQQIQLMKLLQIPTTMLEQRIKEELEINPALEEGERENDPMDEDLNSDRDENFQEDTPNYNEDDDDMRDEYREDPFELGEYLNEYIEDDPATYKLRGEQYSGEEEDKSLPIAVENTFHDYLEQQLGLLDLNEEKENAVALQIIGSIDDDGYLRRDINAIIDDLMFSQNIFVSEAEVKAVLRKIQRFDPPGIGARDLQECLLIQLENKLEQEDQLDDHQLAALRLARLIVKAHFEEFTKKHYEKLQRQLEVSEQTLKAAIDEIIRLNPKPASGYTGSSSRSTQYVVPDFIIYNRDGELELTLNARNAPDLRISEQYKDMLKSYKASAKNKSTDNRQREAVMFIKQKIDSAKWFIDAIRQRQDTMYRTMYAIMQYQYDYFLTGDTRKLRPMILQDIADITGLDISTISRVTNSKFVQTEFGTRLLKAFFSESLQTSEGEEVSTLEVKKILRDLIEAENKHKPLSDEQLTADLQKKGYEIARRTVAKYREQMNLPVARLRKVL